MDGTSHSRPSFSLNQIRDLLKHLDDSNYLGNTSYSRHPRLTSEVERRKVADDQGTRGTVLADVIETHIMRRLSPQDLEPSDLDRTRTEANKRSVVLARLYISHYDQWEVAYQLLVSDREVRRIQRDAIGILSRQLMRWYGEVQE